MIQEIESDIASHPESPSGWFRLGSILMEDPAHAADAEAEVVSPEENLRF